MADELQINASIDATQAISGMKDLADAVQSDAAQMVGAFEQVQNAESELAASSEAITGFQTALLRANADLALSEEAAARAAEDQAAAVKTLQDAQENANSALARLNTLQIAGIESGDLLNAAFESNISSRVVLATATQVLANAEQAFAAAAIRVADAQAVATQAAKNLEAAQLEGLQAMENLAAAQTQDISKKLEMVNSTNAVTGAMNTLTPVVSESSLALDGLQGSLKGVATQLELFVPTGEEAAGALDRFIEGLGIVGGQLSSTGTAVAQQTTLFDNMTVALGEMADAQLGVVSSTGQFTEAQQASSVAVEENVAILEGMDAALAEMAAAQSQAATQASEAAAAQAEYATSIDAVLAEMAAAQVGTAEAAASVKQYTVSLGQGVVATERLREAMAFLNNQSALMNASTEQIAAKQAIVVAEAKKLGATLIQTANGMLIFKAATGSASDVVEVLDKSVQKTTQHMDQLHSTMAYGAARIIAYGTGLGPIGFALGGVARASQVLGPILAAAFPVLLVATFAGLVVDLVEKIRNLDVELLKASQEFDDLASSVRVSADAIELQNLKLEDQISKLEGRPENNLLKISLLESKDAADELDKTLQHALVSELELLQNKGIGVWDQIKAAIPTFLGGEGKAIGSTTDILPSIKPSIEELHDLIGAQVDAREALRNAQADAERLATTGSAGEIAIARDKVRIAHEDLKNANEAIEIARTKARGILDDLESKTREKQYQQQEFPKKLNIPLLPEHGISLEVGEKPVDYSKRFEQIKEGRALLNDLGRAEEEEGRNAIDSNEKTLRTISELQYAREKTLDSPGIKNREEGAKQQLEIEKENANLAYKVYEDKVREEVQLTIEGGAQKGAAEEAGNDKIISQRQSLTTQLLDIQQRGYESELRGLNEKRTLAAKDPNAEKRVAEEEAIDGEISRLRVANEAKKYQITQESEAEIRKLQASSARGRIADAKEAAAELASSLKEAEKVTFTGGEADLRGIEEATRESERAYSEGKLSRDQERADLQGLITLLNQKTEAAKRAILAGITIETAGQTSGQFGKEDSKPFAESQARVNELQRQYTQLVQQSSNALSQLNQAYSKLDTSASAYFTKMKNQTLSVSESFRLSWQHALDQVNTGFANSINQWIEHGKSFGRSMAEVGVSMLTSLTNVFIQLGLRQLETHLATLLGIKIQQAASATSQVASYAAVAGAAGTASWAGAPWPIDSGAAAFGASMYAAALAYAPAASAAGGFDLARETGPVQTLLHPREMVLNAPIAEGLRGIIAQGAGARAGLGTAQGTPGTSATTPNATPDTSGGGGGGLPGFFDNLVSRFELLTAAKLAPVNPAAFETPSPQFSSNNSTTTNNQNINFKFSPIVKGDFDVNKQGEQMFNYFKTKVKKSGFNI